MEEDIKEVKTSVKKKAKKPLKKKPVKRSGPSEQQLLNMQYEESTRKAIERYISRNPKFKTFFSFPGGFLVAKNVTLNITTTNSNGPFHTYQKNSDINECIVRLIEYSQDYETPDDIKDIILWGGPNMIVEVYSPSVVKDMLDAI